MIKGKIHQKDIKLIKIYAFNFRVPKCSKQTLTDMKEGIDNTIIIGDFNTPLLTMDRSSRCKINKQTLDLSYTLAQMN